MGIRRLAACLFKLKRKKKHKKRRESLEVTSLLLMEKLVDTNLVFSLYLHYLGLCYSISFNLINIM